MFKKIIILLAFSLVLACKSKQKVVEKSIVKIPENKEISAENVLQNHTKLPYNFSTLLIKTSVDFKDDKQSIGLNADIKIKKNEIILVSVKLLGITMAKAIITPKEVKYYEKINNTFFEGNYATLSNWLGTDLDFQKVQNLLLGQIITSTKNSNFNLENLQNILVLKSKANENLQEKYVFDSNNFTLKSQEINQITKNRSVSINYLAYNSFAESIFPKELTIFAKQNQKQTEIKLEYRNVAFNENLTFPYSVPEGYKQITID